MYYKDARAHLAVLLGKSDMEIHPHLKEAIMEAMTETYDAEAYLPHIAPAIRGMHLS